MIEVKEGSSLYYSLLWVTDENRLRFVERLSLINALSRTLEDVQEPEIAEQKIHWWHEELDRLSNGQARHPATQACQPHLIDNAEAHNACLTLLSCASTERFTPAATDTELHDLTIRGYQARLALLGHALTSDNEQLDISVHPAPASLAFGLHERLNRLPGLIHRGLAVFSNETYDRVGSKPHQLGKHIRVASDDNAKPSAALKDIPVVVESPERKQLLDMAIAQALEALDNAVNSEQVEAHYRKEHLSPIWRLLVLAQKQVHLWHKHKPDLLRERLTLTPLKKLYYAWCNRR